MGFISNSSSSSFMVAIPKDGDLKAELTEAFKLPDKHPLRDLSQKVVDHILNEIDLRPLKSWKKFCEEYEIDKEDEITEQWPMPFKVRKAFDKDWQVLTGEFQNDDLDLRDIEFDIDNEALICLKEP
jgi:hypothetical protein